MVWTYQTEMVHRARPEGLPVEAVVNDYSPGPSEWRVEQVASSANLGFCAHHDAYRVHGAVLALGRELMTVPAWEPPLAETFRASGDQTWLPRRDAVRTSSLADLVITSALRGAPDWCPEPEVTVRRRGIVHAKLPNGDVRRDRNGRWVEQLCIVDFSGDLPWIVDYCRCLYERWAVGVRRVRESVGGMLTAHTLTDELPSLSPWK